MNDMKIFIERDRPWGDTFGVHMGSVLKDLGGIAIAEPIQFKVRQKGEECFESSAAFRLTPSDAQMFMDELWKVGLRPTEGTGSAGAMAAVQKHLEDMRRLVFTKKEIK